jgi:hypothetical protein
MQGENMKYYLFKHGNLDRTKFCEPELFGKWAGVGLYRNSFRDRTLPLPVTLSVKNKYKPGDYPLGWQRLVSKRLLELIKQLNRDYEALPSQIYYKEKEPIWDTYYSMLFPEYEAFNWDKSVYEADEEKRIFGLDKIVLSKEKLPDIPRENNIFVLREIRTELICTQTAKDLIEQAGIIDVRFIELEVE